MILCADVQRPIWVLHHRDASLEHCLSTHPPCCTTCTPISFPPILCGWAPGFFNKGLQVFTSSCELQISSIHQLIPCCIFHAMRHLMLFPLSLKNWMQPGNETRRNCDVRDMGWGGKKLWGWEQCQVSMLYQQHTHNEVRDGRYMWYLRMVLCWAGQKVWIVGWCVLFFGHMTSSFCWLSVGWPNSLSFPPLSTHPCLKIKSDTPYLWWGKSVPTCPSSTDGIQKILRQPFRQCSTSKQNLWHFWMYCIGQAASH